MDFLAEKIIGKIGFSAQSWVGLSTPTDFSRSCGLWLTKAGLRQFQEGFRYDPAPGRTHFEWGAVIEGEMELVTNGQTYRITEGMYYCMPEETFRKRFTAAAGASPMQYVQRIRMQMAKEQLSGSEKTVRQIAFSCGFTDPYYFSRVFKKSEGLSPLQFRKETVHKNL